MSKQTKIPTKKKIVIDLERYYTIQNLLGYVSELYLPCKTYAYQDLKYKTTKLLKNKFLKVIPRGEKYISLKLDFEECVAYYYCCILNGLNIGSCGDDVVHFMVTVLSLEQREDLNRQIAYIKQFYDHFKPDISNIQSANQGQNLLEI